MKPNYNTFRINTPKNYDWKPKEDITTFELALCLPAFSFTNKYDMEFFILQLPDNARRHFEDV